MPSPLISAKATRAPPRKLLSSMPKKSTIGLPVAPSRARTRGPPPPSGVMTTSATPSPLTSAAATLTPAVKLGSNASKLRITLPVAASIRTTCDAAPGPVATKTTP